MDTKGCRETGFVQNILLHPQRGAVYFAQIWLFPDSPLTLSPQSNASGVSARHRANSNFSGLLFTPWSGAHSNGIQPIEKSESVLDIQRESDILFVKQTFPARNRFI